MNVSRAYSQYNQHALMLFGQLIRVGRIEAKMTVQEVAERAGISRGLLQRIEKGDPRCAIGSVFEAAMIVGVKLFDVDDVRLKYYIQETAIKLTLLPKSIRTKMRNVDDNF